ncbi:nascent polypeptide-associated complex subunit alpha, muscle-specific form-like [Camelus ferus]|uniref:Nascent polypeptide-associated complex subunit alpha, muscle-specific form-like n=1 Tax=Camelus ferus TaxID=419612 RepID=A0A8B8UHS9_CAMFR|nr:nascent polypeptide-associated complex subunit alpha, muscle-specific form-like [Camelus ferus]
MPSAPESSQCAGRGGRDRAKGGAAAVLPGVGALFVGYRIDRSAHSTLGAAGVSKTRSRAGHPRSPKGTPRLPHDRARFIFPPLGPGQPQDQAIYTRDPAWPPAELPAGQSPAPEGHPTERPPGEAGKSRSCGPDRPGPARIRGHEGVRLASQAPYRGPPGVGGARPSPRPAEHPGRAYLPPLRRRRPLPSSLPGAEPGATQGSGRSRVTSPCARHRCLAPPLSAPPGPRRSGAPALPDGADPGGSCAFSPCQPSAPAPSDPPPTSPAPDAALGAWARGPSSPSISHSLRARLPLPRIDRSATGSRVLRDSDSLASHARAEPSDRWGCAHSRTPRRGSVRGPCGVSASLLSSGVSRPLSPPRISAPIRNLGFLQGAGGGGFSQMLGDASHPQALTEAGWGLAPAPAWSPTILTPNSKNVATLAHTREEVRDAARAASSSSVEGSRVKPTELPGPWVSEGTLGKEDSAQLQMVPQLPAPVALTGFPEMEDGSQAPPENVLGNLERLLRVLAAAPPGRSGDRSSAPTQDQISGARGPPGA